MCRIMTLRAGVGGGERGAGVLMVNDLVQPSQFEVAATLYCALVGVFGSERVRGGFTLHADTRRTRGAKVNVALLSHDLERILAVFDCRRHARDYRPSARSIRAGKLANASALTVGGLDAIAPLVAGLRAALSDEGQG